MTDQDLQEQAWFEMADLRRKSLNTAVWIPLRAIHTLKRQGSHSRSGFTEEFFGVASLAVPVDQLAHAQKLGWMDVGISHPHRSYTQEDEYVPVEIERHQGVDGVRLVIDQAGNRLERNEWHLHPDLIVGLELKREQDVWLAINENYEQVARLRRGREGEALLEIKAEFLKDYLCARGMGLFVSSYRSRTQVVESAGHIHWPNGKSTAKTGSDRWQGAVHQIHEGGMPFGSSTAVFHAARTDIDPTVDVPILGVPNDENTESKQWTIEASGKKLYRVQGELWRKEWVAPGTSSTRVRGDEQASTILFTADAAGSKKSADELEHSGQWLWFRPDVIVALAQRRGGSLSWYSRDTGDVSCSPSYHVHFGVNQLGLVTVYAKDVAQLPEWQQRIWAGHNVTPEGGVSDELLAAQVRVDPANTQAPEEFLERALHALDVVGQKAFGIGIVRKHDQQAELLRAAHRFRSLNQEGLFSLAKDLARLTADSIDATAIQTIAKPAKGEKWGSLKSLEKLLATKVGAEGARAIMGPLFGIYDLRVADAHLHADDLSASLALIRIDPDLPYPLQGLQMLGACVTVLYQIVDSLGKPNGSVDAQAATESA